MTSQTLLLFRKDLYRLRPALVALLLALSWGALVTILLAATARADSVGALSARVWGMPWLHWLVDATVVVVTGLVVQDDPLGHGSVFWRTRPLSRQAVVGSKLLFFGLFLVALPCFVQLLAARAVGAPFGMALVTETLGLLVPRVLLAAALASVTPNLLVFLAACAGLGSLWGLTRAFLWLASGLDAAGAGVAMSALAAGGGLAVFVHQIMTQRTKRSLILGSALIALAIAAVAVTPIAIAWASSPDSSLGDAGAPAIDLGIDARGDASEPSSVRSKQPLEGPLIAPLVVEGLEEGDVLLLDRIHSQIAARDGERRASEWRGRRWLAEGPPPLGGPGFQWLGREQSSPFIRLSDGHRDWLAAHGDEEVDLEVELELTIVRQTVLGRIPLVEGARFRGGADALEIESISSGRASSLSGAATPPDELRLVLRGIDYGGTSSAIDYASFALVNRRRREVLASGSTSMRFSGFRTLVIAGPGLAPFDIDVRFPVGATSADPTGVSDSWLEGAELLILRADTQTMHRHLTVDGVRIADLTPEAWRARQPTTGQ